MAQKHDRVGSLDRPARPSVLSDPYHDNGEERLRELLATKDADLKWADFAAFFGPLPAGTFAEVVYFLPLVFRHMQERRDGCGENLDGFTYWLSRNHEELAGLGATMTVATELRRTLDAWTAAFHVAHYDEEACRAKGWTLKHYDIVDCSQDVAEMIHCLVKERVFAGVAEAFIADLADLAESDSATKAAWYLEFARVQEEGLFSGITGELASPEHEEEMAQVLRRLAADDGIPFDEDDIEGLRQASRESDAVKSDAILRLVRSNSLRRQALGRVKSSDLFDPAATYWRDTLRLLDLDG